MSWNQAFHVWVIIALGGRQEYLCPAVMSWACFIVSVMEFAGFSHWVFAIIKIRADAVIQKLWYLCRCTVYGLKDFALPNFKSLLGMIRPGQCFSIFFELCYIFLPHKTQEFMKLNHHLLIIRSATATLVSILTYPSLQMSSISVSIRTNSSISETGFKCNILPNVFILDIKT